MTSIFNITFYVLIFLSVYVQVFFLVTFLENRKRIITRNGKIKLANYPSVTIAVPCWNEEATVGVTVRSILDLNYPKDKVSIFLIDDGSTDGTLNVLNSFKEYPNIKVFHKENGGKYTALNLALENSETDFFGGFDADSIAHRESLIRLMSYFERYPKVMAVVPSVIVNDPNNFIQNVQEAEYSMGVYLKKMFSFLGAINVTPGPLTIFRRQVFDDLGEYRHGHNTEDMEIAYRMQKNNYEIEHCNDAYVYTNTPSSVKKLYKQRLRWIYGFINNTVDYRNVLFKKKYGNFSFFTLPMGIISIISVSYLFCRVIYNLGNYIYSKILIYQTVGFNFSIPNFKMDPFFINLQSFLLLILAIFIFVIFSMAFGKKMTEGKFKVSPGMIYFVPVFFIIAPFWFLKAIYNTFFSKRPAWR